MSWAAFNLFRLFMWRVDAAPLAKLFELKTVLDDLLVFARVVVCAFAFRTLHFDHGVLGHRGKVTGLDECLQSTRLGGFRQDRWSRWSDSNRRPSLYKSVALPLSYIGMADSCSSCPSPKAKRAADWRSEGESNRLWTNPSKSQSGKRAGGQRRIRTFEGRSRDVYSVVCLTTSHICPCSAFKIIKELSSIDKRTRL